MVKHILLAFLVLMPVLFAGTYGKVDDDDVQCVETLEKAIRDTPMEIDTDNSEDGKGRKALKES